jgi:hypothetical protein
LGRCIPLKREYGLYGLHGLYGTENARELLSVRIFCFTFGTSDSSEDGFVNFVERKSGKCYNKQSLYSVYQYNNIFHILSKEQYRNKINNLSDSALFTFHLVSSFALGRIKSYFLQLSISYQSRIVTAKREKDGLVVFASYLH